MRISSKLIIPQYILELVLLCLTFYEVGYVPHLVFIAFKYVVLLCIFLRYISSFVVRNLKISCCILGYGIASVVPTALNHASLNTIVASVFVMIHIFDVFFVIDKNLRMGSLRTLTKTMLLTFLPLVLLNDALMLVIDYDFFNPAEEYFIGNKFIVSYLHCFVAALSFICYYHQTKSLEKKIKNRSIPICFILLSLLVIPKVTCSTGMISLAVMVLVLILPVRIKRLLSSSQVMIAGAAVMNVLLLGSYNLSQNSAVKYFITEILGKTSTLTGRMQIWRIIFEYIAEKPFWGYGYYNTVIQDHLGYGNPQNGVLKLLLDGGLVSLISYMLMVYVSFSEKHKKDEVVPMIAFFYAMLTASLVEINLNHMVTFAAMAICYCWNKYSPYNKQRITSSMPQ